jgi:RNA-directed DNA polymerase
MIKLDVEEFFPSISALSVYQVFRQHANFPALVSFELARLCTVEKRNVVRTDTSSDMPYRRLPAGYLPIGAPTSPMISNVVLIDADEHLGKVARENNARYGRYADDIIFTSVSRKFNRKNVANILAEAKFCLNQHKLKLNSRKTAVLSPGTRKLFLGLDITTGQVRVPHELLSRLREHYRFISKYGALEHSSRRGFTSVAALERHLWGLISFVRQVDPKVAARLRATHQSFEWPYLV